MKGRGIGDRSVAYKSAKTSLQREGEKHGSEGKNWAGESFACR
jgi:hypothetical protein